MRLARRQDVGKDNVMNLRPRAVISLLAVMVVSVSTVFGAEEIRAHIGIMLDPQPLGDLLIKHLQLGEGEGARITNVVVGSAADKAGLERDDIVVGFEGSKIDESAELIEALRKCEIGQEATLEIIHLGRRKSVKMTLGSTGGKIEWKYLWEPYEMEQWQPGRVFRLDPGQDGWIEVPFHELVPKPEMLKNGGELDVTRFFRERYRFEYSEEGQEYQITIEGDPHEEDTIIVVKIGSKERRVSVKDVDELPERYHKSAVDALEKAKKGRGRGRATIEILPGGMGFSDNPTTPGFPWPNLGPDSERFNLLEGRLRQLEDRLEKLERQRNRLEGEVEAESKRSSGVVGTAVVIGRRQRS